MKTIKIYKVINSIYTGMNLTNYINAISSKHTLYIIFILFLNNFYHIKEKFNFIVWI